MIKQRFVKWRKSFRYAYDGLKYAFDTQRNMKFHFVVAFLVLLLALVCGLGRTDILFILMAVTLMFVTELINTAIEKTVDLVTPDIHPLAKIAKDVAAASVLVSAVFALFVGFIVFYEPLDRVFSSAHIGVKSMNPANIWVFVTLIILVVVVIESRFSDKGKFVKPSLFAAISFSIATLISIYVELTFVALLAFTLAGMSFVLLYDKKARSGISLVFGACLGVLVTFLIFAVMQLI